MKTDNSAKTSGKTATATNPFQDIVNLEETEEKRVQTEVDAMAAEEEKQQKTCEKKEAEAEQQERDKATGELKQLREEELAEKLSAAQHEAGELTTKLDAAYGAKGTELAASLTNRITGDDSPVFT